MKPSVRSKHSATSCYRAAGEHHPPKRHAQSRLWKIGHDGAWPSTHPPLPVRYQNGEQSGDARSIVVIFIVIFVVIATVVAVVDLASVINALNHVVNHKANMPGIQFCTRCPRFQRRGLDHLQTALKRPSGCFSRDNSIGEMLGTVQRQDGSDLLIIPRPVQRTSRHDQAGFVTLFARQPRAITGPVVLRTAAIAAATNQAKFVGLIKRSVPAGKIGTGLLLS